jgi:hypothetical protein
MSWLKRLANTTRSGRVEREIRRELEFHVAERADELRDSGLSPEEAEWRARVKLGNPLLQAERTRDMDVALWADGIARNLRHAARSLGRAPGFALTVVATLALGIGANTAVFGALDAVLLRPLPFPDAERVVRLSQTLQTSSETMIAPARLEDWNRLNSTFSAISGYGVEDVSETSGDLPERVRRDFVTPRLLEVWGVAPALGRGFSEEEHRFGGPAAALVSDRHWRRRLASTPDVLSHRVQVGNASVPTWSDAPLLSLLRLSLGATRAAVAGLVLAETLLLALVGGALGLPVAFALSALSLASVGLYGTLSYTVGLRRREAGLRMALGALRADIVRQFLGQGLRVVGLACAGGVGLALALRRVVAGLLYGVSATDAATLLGVVAMVAVVAALAALAPALRASRLDPMRVLRES